MTARPKLLFKCQAPGVVTITTYSTISCLVSKYKPHFPNPSITIFERTDRQLQLYRGYIPLFYEKERAGDSINVCVVLFYPWKEIIRSCLNRILTSENGS